MPDHNKTNETKQAFNPGWLRFIGTIGLIIGGATAAASLLKGFLKNKSGIKDSIAVDRERFMEVRMFFTRLDDFAVLAQATERIYPEEGNGPGAVELGVPYFIDKQLAGSWGINKKDYRQEPFSSLNTETGQSRLTRREVFIKGIRKMNELSQKRFDTTFDKADKSQQIEILKDFEVNRVKIKGIRSASFFELLQQSTLEGAYADPLYGGNRNMKGWKMKEFPGAPAFYDDIIERDEFVKIEPVNLTRY